MKIYHNPRCSKSRQTLQLIQEAGVEPEIVLYLDKVPTAAELKDIITKLGFESPRDLMRRGEKAYKELGLKEVQDEAALIQAMINNPKLIERPIVIKGDKAVLGRPPENALNLL